MLASDILSALHDGKDLPAAQTQAIFDKIFEGNLTDGEIEELLIGLRDKGETVDEILGAARSMRAHMQPLKAPNGTIDIVGTGGDNHGTLNVSTATAFVVAACGAPVAKHGNRASSSKSGSSDALRLLGVNLEPRWDLIERCLAEANLCFLFAPRHHPAMVHVAEVRRKLKTRTIFNLLGPLTNPANVSLHMIGVYDLELLGPLAEVLKQLGSERAWLAHGHDGLDEISITGPTDIVELRAGQINHFTISPQELGLPLAKLDDIKGGEAADNAEAIRKLFHGEKSAYRNIVLMNAAAALVVAGKTDTLSHGVKLAAEAIDSRAAQKKLDDIIRITNESAA